MAIRCSFRPLFPSTGCVVLTLLMACGGGSGSGGSGIPAPVAPPTALVYATNPAVYTQGQAIPLNTPSHGGGAVAAYTVAPTLPAGLALNGTSGVVSGTPTAIVAPAPYTVTATNGGGSTTAVLTLAVNDIPPTNLLYTTPAATYTVGTTITPNLATHDGGTVVAYAVAPALTAGLVFNPASGAITGTPSAAAPATTYTVTATNSGGNTAATVSITVNAAAVAPAFTTQPSNATITAGQNAQFVVAASGAPTPTLQWQVSTDHGGSWSGIPGATNVVLNVLGATLSQNGQQFHAVATNGSSTVTSNAAVLTVNAAQGAKAFGTATLIESGATAAGRPRIAFAPNGDALAVWMQQSDGLYFHIWANHFTAATNTWGTEELIGPGASDAWDPRIAIDVHGNALVVWYQDGDPTGAGRNDIWSNYYTAGSGWGVAMLVESDNAGPALNPQVAIDPSGVGVAVWVQSDGTASQIRSNRFTAGAWGTVTLLEAVTPGASAGPQIAIDASGHALAVWSRYNGTANLAMANRYSVGAGWGTAEIIGSDTALVGIGQTQIASDGSGNAVAVWIQGGKVQANHYAPGSGWSTAALIAGTGGDANFPQVAFDTTGNAMAVWQQNSGFSTPTRIWSNRYTVGSGWGGFPALIQTDISGGGTANAEKPQVAMDASGDALAVWVQPDGASDNTPDIWVNRYTAGSGWGTTANLGQVRINIPGAAGSPAGWPQIAIDANGNALVVWYQSDGTADSIWSNRYQ